jgi:hypothetical protein
MTDRPRQACTHPERIEVRRLCEHRDQVLSELGGETHQLQEAWSLLRSAASPRRAVTLVARKPIGLHSPIAVAQPSAADMRFAGSPTSFTKTSVSVQGEEQHLNQRPVSGRAAGGLNVRLWVIADSAIARRDRLRALTITRTDRPGDTGRTHPAAGLVPQRPDKQRQPGNKVAPPVVFLASLHKSRLPMSH